MKFNRLVGIYILFFLSVFSFAMSWIYYETNYLEILSDHLSHQLSLGFIIVILQFIPFIIPLIIMFFIYISNFENNSIIENVKKNGIPGTAVIVKKGYSNIKINQRPLINVYVDLQGNYRLIRDLPASSMFDLNVGDRIYIKYDSSNPDNIIATNVMGEIITGIS